VVDEEENKYKEEEGKNRKKCDVTRGNVNIKSVVARIHVTESIFKSFTCKAEILFLIN
jgi:hypothetical protein